MWGQTTRTFAGGTPKAAALHVARTVCRRAERAVITLQREAEVPQIVIVYLNRLSDLREFLQAARTLLAEHIGAAR